MQALQYLQNCCFGACKNVCTHHNICLWLACKCKKTFFTLSLFNHILQDDNYRGKSQNVKWSRSVINISEHHMTFALPILRLLHEQRFLVNDVTRTKITPKANKNISHYTVCIYKKHGEYDWNTFSNAA